MYMLMMVLDNSAHLNDVLTAWREAGIRGVTILESTGMNRVLPRDAPNLGFMGFSHLLGSGRVGNQTLMAVIDSLEVAETAVSATEAIIGKLTDPHTGIVFVMPVAKTWGVAE